MFLYLFNAVALPVLQQDDSDGNFMWYVLIALIILLLLLLFWWWWREPEAGEAEAESMTPPAEAESMAPPAETESMTPPAAAESAVPETPVAGVALAGQTTSPAQDVAVQAAEATPVQPDDLTRIEGIGPKISGILHEAGIHTFAQLAATDVETLNKILTGKVRLFFPDTWPEQAALAAKGDWEALAQLQATFKAGRRK